MAPCFKKSFKIRSWVPSPQMPYFGGGTSHLSDLKKYRRLRGLSETEIIFLLVTKGPTSSKQPERRAVKEDELPKELEQ